MSIIKQKIFNEARDSIDKLLENWYLGGDSLKFDDSSSYIDSIYGECEAYVVKGGITGRLGRLFDFYYFKVFNSKSNKDFSGDVKKIVKSLGIDSYYMLEGYYVLGSYIVRECKEKMDSGGSLKGTELSVRWIANTFKLFLCYCFDICFGGKKISSVGFSCKYRELDDAVALAGKKFKDFNRELTNLIKSITSYEKPNIPREFMKVNLSEIEFATFQQMKWKYDFIFLDDLIRNLLPEESAYYFSRFKYSHFIFSSLRSESVEKEYNIEIHDSMYKLLKKRAYLIPHSGISITPSSVGISLDIFERQFKGDNYLIIISNSKDTDISFFTVINLTREYLVSNAEYLYDIFNFLYYFYRLDEYAVGLGSRYVSDPHLLLSYKTTSFISDGIVVIKGTSSSYTDFVVEVPYYWKYRGKSKKPIGRKEFLGSCSGGSFEYISAFKRRLPSGSVASERAKELAEYYCVELEEGETLVSPFIRVR